MADNPYARYVQEANPYARFAEDKPPVMRKIGAEGLPDAVKAVVGDFNPLSQLAVGAKSAWDLGAMRLKQLAGGTLTPQQVLETQANRAMLQESPMALLGNIGTNIAATGGPTASLYRGLSGAASKVLPAWAQIAAPTIGAAGVGGLTAATTQPVLEGESTLDNAGAGAIAGAVVDASTRGLGRLVQPITQSPAVQKLLDYKIVPTPGDAAGGAIKFAEEKLSSLPFVSDLIKNRQVGARDELNKAALGLATPPGQAISAIGKEGVEQGKDAFSRAYGNVYQGSQIGLEKQLVQDLAAAKNAPTIPMSGAEVKQFDQIIKREVFDRLKSGPVPTDDAKKIIEANLGKAAYKAEGPLQDALKAAKTSFRDAMGRSVGGNGALELKGIDKAYSNFMDVKTAAKSAEGAGGVFTPRMIQRAAKDGGELKALADAAQKVLPPNVPNSGTTDRALFNYLLLSSGAMGANQVGGSALGRDGPLVNPGYLAALALAPALYSRTGARYMMGDLIPGQPALAEALRQSAPYAAQGGALYAPYR